MSEEVADKKRTDYLQYYHISEAINTLKEKSEEWKTPALIVHDIKEVHTKDKEVRDAWKNIFKFRTQMGITPRSGTKKPITYRVRRYYDSKIVRDQARVIVRTFKKYECTQKEVSRRTGISRSVVSWICKEIPEAYEAYTEAKQKRARESYKRWARKQRGKRG